MTDISKLKVLIIDDISTVRSVLSTKIKSIGITNILQSDCISDAWKQIKAEHERNIPINLVFCDWNMPGGDGVELLNDIRSSKEETLRLTKFAMVTGANDKVIEAMDAGANNIIHKPFTTEIVKSKLEIIFNCPIEDNSINDFQIFKKSRIS